MSNDYSLLAMGRPSKYTPEIADNICKRLAKGESLRRICTDADMPSEAAVRQWAVDDYQGFYAQYARSRDIGLDAIADEMLDIADDGQNDFMDKELRDGRIMKVPNKELVMRSRLRFDARQWYLSKLAPKRYGKKITQEMTGADGAPLNPSMNNAQLAAALNALVTGAPLVNAQPFTDGDDGSDLV